jgi:hypothetical protein
MLISCGAAVFTPRVALRSPGWLMIIRLGVTSQASTASTRRPVGDVLSG